MFFETILQYCLTKKHKKESCYHFLITTLKMAGVAGFEPTNDGVRGIKKLQNMAQNTRKTYKKHFFLDFPPNLPHKKYMAEEFSEG